MMAASWAILEASQEPCWAMGSHLGGYETARRAILAIVEPSGGHLGLKKRWDTTQDCAGLRRTAQDLAGLGRTWQVGAPGAEAERLLGLFLKETDRILSSARRTTLG